MRASGQYAEYGTTVYPEVSYDDATVVLRVPEEQLASIADAVESGVGPGGGWARVPKRSLRRRLAVTVWVAWQGERCSVARVDGDQALLHYDGRNPERAVELGMEGSNYMGWSVTAPVAELEPLEIEERQFA